MAQDEAATEPRQAVGPPAGRVAGRAAGPVPLPAPGSAPAPTPVQPAVRAPGAPPAPPPAPPAGPGAGPSRFSTVDPPDTRRLAPWDDYHARSPVGLVRTTMNEAPLAATEPDVWLLSAHGDEVALHHGLDRLRTRLGARTALKDLGPAEEALEPAAELVLAAAVPAANPRPVSLDAVRAPLRVTWAGTASTPWDVPS
jgi:hypothetical protein